MLQVYLMQLFENSKNSNGLAWQEYSRISIRTENLHSINPTKFRKQGKPGLTINNYTFLININPPQIKFL